jgi:hypothetical protein
MKQGLYNAGKFLYPIIDFFYPYGNSIIKQKNILKKRDYFDSCIALSLIAGMLLSRSACFFLGLTCAIKAFFST